MRSVKNLQKRVPFWLTTFVLSRLLYFLVALIWEKSHEKQFGIATFCHFDCKWYLRIIDNGYLDPSKMPGHEGATNWAFFPAFPITTRIVEHLLRLNPVIAGLGINLIASLMTLYLLNKYLSIDFSKKITNFALFLFAFSPANAYFNSLYSEALYSFLLVSLVYSIKKERYLLAGLIGSFFSVSRVTGLFVSILIFSFILLDKKYIREKIYGFLLTLILPSIFFLYAFFETGDLLKSIHAHKAWGVEPKNPIISTSNVLQSTHITTWGYFILVVTSIVICTYFIKKKRFYEALSLLPVLLSSIFTTQINYRYFLGIFPIYLFLALITSSRDKIKKALYVLSVIGLILGCIFWITNQGFMV